MWALLFSKLTRYLLLQFRNSKGDLEAFTNIPKLLIIKNKNSCKSHRITMGYTRESDSIRSTALEDSVQTKLFLWLADTEVMSHQHCSLSIMERNTFLLFDLHCCEAWNVLQACTSGQLLQSLRHCALSLHLLFSSQKCYEEHQQISSYVEGVIQVHLVTEM